MSKVVELPKAVADIIENSTTPNMRLFGKLKAIMDNISPLYLDDYLWYAEEENQEKLVAALLYGYQVK